jgi:hypothetical protein
MIKTNTIDVTLHGFFHHRQKIAKATMARRTPSNGLETANQKEKFQPESWAIGFVFMMLSKAFEGRHFTNTWDFLRNVSAQDTRVQPWMPRGEWIVDAQNQIKCALDEVPFNVGVGLFFHRSFTLSFGFCVTSGRRPFFAAAQVCFCR